MGLSKPPPRPTAWYDKPNNQIARIEGLLPRNIRIGEHRTSVRLDATILEAIKRIAEREGMTPNALYQKVDREKPKGLNFTIALRSFALRYFMNAVMNG